MSFDWKIDMDELQSGKAVLAFALVVSFAMASAGQEQQTTTQKSSEQQQSEAEKKAAEEKAKQAQKKPAEGKTIDTSPKIVPRPDLNRTSSPLVDAAKKAKENKQKARIVIGNDDVKKSQGKLTVLKPRPEIEVPEEGTREKLEKEQAAKSEAKKQADERLEKARKTVEELENELARLEEEYYTESDLDYRDDVIEERFNETKKQLDKAREELTASRDDATKAETAPAPPPAEKPPVE